MSDLREVYFPKNPPYGTTHLEHGRVWEYVEPGMWKSAGSVGGGDDDDGDVAVSADWVVITASGFKCEANTKYLDMIVGTGAVSLPSLALEDKGKFVEIADGQGHWGDKPLTVTLNGMLNGESPKTLVLDHTEVVVTFVWSGTDWSVFMTQTSDTFGDAPSDGKTYGRKDGQWVEVQSGGGTGGSVDWVDVLNKPEPIKNLAAENATKVSLVSGGSY